MPGVPITPPKHDKPAPSTPSGLDPNKPLGSKPHPQYWLSPAEISSVLAAHGFHDDGLVNGIAIVLAESKGFIKARNTNTNGSVDRGIWQYNDRAHPEVSTACADNPICATQHALTDSHGGTDFGIWSTWKSGSYKAYLPLAKLAAKTTQPSGFESFAKKTGDVVGGVAGAMTALVHLIGALFRFSTWIRIGEVTFGAVLLLVAVKMISNDLGLSGVEEVAKRGLNRVPKVGGALAAWGA